MSDTTQNTATSETSLRLFALVAYGLLVLAFTNGVSGIAGVVIAYLKRDEARGTPYESHFSNMIFMFWASVALVVLFIAAIGFGAMTVFSEPHHDVPVSLIGLGIGAWLCGVVFVVWYLYHAVRGFVRALDGKAYR
jgi:uncharacterized membrane protein